MHAVVVGGGMIGLASAHSLAERGVDVTVCEKGSVGAGNTERSVGGIRAQFSTRVNVALSVAAMDVWEAFDERFDTDIAYRRTGYLFLARDDDTAAQFRENVRMQNDLGVDSEYLEPAAARDHCAGIDAEQFVGATYHAGDGFCDPHLALQAYSGAVAEAGVDVRTGTPVEDVLTEDGRAVGVETPDGTVEADVVVNAAGAWARNVAAMAGVDLPVAPKRRQIAVVEPERAVPEDDPLTVDLDRRSYFRPERDGNALVGGHFGGPDPDRDPDGYDGDVDIDWAADAIGTAGEWTDYFGPGARIRRGWAGLYAVTPDHHPVLEETIPGLINAVGFSGHGFQHAPATGKIVAELAVDGAASLVDVSALSSDRFERGDLIEEANVA